MTTRAVEEVEEWDSAPLRGGYHGLHDLADDEFSGVVQTGRAKLCMLNGTVVGILDGDIGDFEDAEGTAYKAPSPALPLLALMQERSDEVRAKYYTEDTSISEVDETLSDGGFTGYVELSENVLSGDYYVVYHDGRSMAVAFVGNTGQLLTDDEAFERADGEVGIYEVRPAEVDAIDIPEVEREPEPKSESDAAASGAATAATDAETDAADPSSAPASADPSPDDATTSPDGQATDQSGADAGRTTDGSSTADADTAAAESDQVETESGSRSTGAGEEPAATGDRGREPDAGREARDEPADERERERERRPDERSRDEQRGADREDRARQSPTEASTPSRTSDASTGSRPERTESGADGTGVASSDRTVEETGEGTGAGAGASAGSTGQTPGRESGTVDRDAGGRSGPGGGAEPDRPEERRPAASGGATTPDDVETRSIPSLDPSRTTSGAGGAGGAAVGGPSPGFADRSGESAEPGGRRNEPAEPGGRRDEPTTPEPSHDPPAGRSESGTASRQREAGTSGAATAGSGDASSGSASETSPGRESGSAGRESGSAGREGGSAGREGGSAGRGGRERAGGAPDAGGPDPQVADLEAELEEREAEIDRLEDELSEAEAEADDLRATLEDVRAERDELRSRVDDLEADRDRLRSERDDLDAEVDRLEDELDRLETQVEDLESEYGATADADQRMSPMEALDQTNLFVRYESKGQATLESAHSGNASRQEVGENLGLEYHTQFETDAVSVAGRPFDQFLRGTIQYRFVTWVINDLLYEIRDTGKVAALQELYDAIPQIDRAELNGTVSAEYTADGQERRTQESFDVVIRDRMGNPLMVANLNDSRQAATESMMSSLVTASSHVGESDDALAASFLVTSSFFEPEALETAADATSGGLLNRDKRESFVKLSRKRGYHLCLVEAREDNFHLAVPEL